MVGRTEYKWRIAVFHPADVVPTFSFPNKFFHSLFENGNFVGISAAVYKRRWIAPVESSISDWLNETLRICTLGIGDFGQHQQTICFSVYGPIVRVVTNIIIYGS